mgnify:CR=1 FL=1
MHKGKLNPKKLYTDSDLATKEIALSPLLEKGIKYRITKKCEKEKAKWIRYCICRDLGLIKLFLGYFPWNRKIIVGLCFQLNRQEYGCCV